MTEFHDTPRAVTLLAIDVPKGHHVVLVEPSAPARRQRFRLSDGVEEYERFAGYLRGTGATALIGFEATGN
jgi:hypothetical protein